MIQMRSILDVADIVYVDPVNTGFSRIIGEQKREQFFGVNEDVEYLARWIGAFVTRRGRWTSPKYLIGESYGTTRASGGRTTERRVSIAKRARTCRIFPAASRRPPGVRRTATSWR